MPEMLSWLAAYEPTTFTWYGLLAAWIAAVWWMLTPMRVERTHDVRNRDAVAARTLSADRRASVVPSAERDAGRAREHLLAPVRRGGAHPIGRAEAGPRLVRDVNLAAIDRAMERQQTRVLTIHLDTVAEELYDRRIVGWWALTRRDQNTLLERQARLMRIAREVMSTARKRCPCEFGSPCKPTCTCAQPALSGGCRRCCSYGSEEQQRAAAEHIVATEQRIEQLRQAVETFVTSGPQS